jgi:hypothetical protein
MNRMSILVAALGAVLLVAACSDDTTLPKDSRAPDKRKVVPDLGPTPDSATADIKINGEAKAPVCDQTKLGLPCTKSGSECGNDVTCLLTSSTAGVCVCQGCTAADTTKGTKDSCPGAATGANICAAIDLADGTTESFCMKTCKPRLGANDCTGGLYCDPSSAGDFGLDVAVCAYSNGCKADADCPVTTATACSVSKADCAAPEVCAPVISGNDTGRCTRAGKCDTASGLCDKHSFGLATAKVGDPCTSDLECDSNMVCMIEVDEAKYYKKAGENCADASECCTSSCDTTGKCAPGLCTVNRRNGYCAITDCLFGASYTIKACPAGSACNGRFYTGMCQKTCDMTKPEECRGNAKDLYGDYECRRWGNLTFNGVDPAVPGNVPVCDFGTSVPCTFFKGAGTLDCAVLGSDDTGKTNPTEMKCRTLDGKVTTDPYDATGFCFDTTSSGTDFRSPLPTP